MADITEEFIIAQGGLADGFTFIGPFESHEGAAMHGAAYLGEDEEWTIMPITDPALFREFVEKKGLSQ